MSRRDRSLYSLTVLAFLAATILLGISPAAAQDTTDTADTTAMAAVVLPAPPTSVRAVDAPNDHGHGIDVTWELSADDGAGRNNILAYKVLRSPRMEGPIPIAEIPAGDASVQVFSSVVYGEAGWRLIEGEWDTVQTEVAGKTEANYRGTRERDNPSYLPDWVDFRYKVVAATVDGAEASSEATPPVHSHGHLIHQDRVLHITIPALIYTALILGFVGAAKKGRELYIRPLAGINAVDEAIGRATEMNRPILYVLGLGAADEIATIASLTILSRVAKKVAEHRTELLVPCYDPVVMTIAQETVKQAYLDAARPDEYKEDIAYYVTQDQFPYVAAVNGTMLRRKTATNFYLGVFYAESLILAETGSLAGSIQISGTDRVTQIPFFVVACDYTLIGEELYAASAYLGREPKLLGTLKAQDMFKVLWLLFLAVGSIGAILNLDWIMAMFRMNV